MYARENALLLNQETEGSIAVGDTATVQGSSGTYTIIHVAAGPGDYTLPAEPPAGGTGNGSIR
nr:hypothetical protein [Microbacterium pygmaeum]